MRVIFVIAISVFAATVLPVAAAAQEEEPTFADQHEQEGLKLEAGTMQAGGMVGFQVTSYISEGEAETTSALLVLAPQFGYFVIDHLELVARIGYAHELADEDWYTEYESLLDFGLGIQYFAGSDGLYGYFGLQLGMEFWDVADDPYKWFEVTVPLGMLFPLNRHVAVDVGARFSALVSLEGDDFAIIDVPMGYLGLQGFF